MKTNYIYDIFETNRKNKSPDLTIGLAMFVAEHPEVDISHEEDKAIREFMGAHYEDLVAAFKLQDRAKFDEVVEACKKADEEKEVSADV